MTDQIGSIHKELDRVKHNTKKGGEYWSAREIQEILGYDVWYRFDGAIQRAKKACESAGHDATDHFHDTVNMVTIGSGAERQKKDVLLDRYACYLVAMNGDSSKPEIASAQTYFAVQTRRMELEEKALEFQKRVAARERVTIGNKALQAAAKGAGVTKYAIFNDAGYRGLYGGLGLREIKNRKQIGEKEHLLDRAGRAELAANEFRITQAEQKIVRENVQGEKQAINAHREVGEEVRRTIAKIGGTMPEDMLPEPHLKDVQKSLKKASGKLASQK